jgi:hypothetical protein
MTTEKYNRFKITTKKGLIFEIILAELKEGDYEFGKVEITDTLSTEQGNDYIDTIEKLFEICGYNDEE